VHRESAQAHERIEDDEEAWVRKDPAQRRDGSGLMLERMTPEAKKIIERSLREALQLGHNEIGEEHLLLALLSGKVAEAAFAEMGTPSELRQDVINYLLSEGRKKQEKEQESLQLSETQVSELVNAIQQVLLRQARKNL